MLDEKAPVKGKIALIVFLIIAGLIVFVGMLGSAYMSGLLQYEKTNRSRNYAHQTSKEIEKCGANPHAIDVANCIEKIIKSHNEHQRAEDDRIAQSDMARWALWMTIFTFGTLLVTAAGVILIYKTMRFTGETLTLAKTTNDAAWETVKVTREIGEKQVKAYVTCTGAKFLVEDDLIWLDVFLKNTGNSPAFNIEIVGTFSAFVLWRPPEHTKNVRIDVTGGSCGVISAGGEDTGFLFASRSSEGSYSVEQFDELIEIVDHLGSIIRISWTDVFENTQHEWFVLNKPRGSDTRGAGGGDIIAQGKLASHHQTQHHQSQ